MRFEVGEIALVRRWDGRPEMIGTEVEVLIVDPPGVWAICGSTYAVQTLIGSVYTCGCNLRKRPTPPDWNALAQPKVREVSEA